MRDRTESDFLNRKPGPGSSAHRCVGPGARLYVSIADEACEPMYVVVLDHGEAATLYDTHGQKVTVRRAPRESLRQRIVAWWMWRRKWRRAHGV